MIYAAIPGKIKEKKMKKYDENGNESDYDEEDDDKQYPQQRYEGRLVC